MGYVFALDLIGLIILVCDIFDFALGLTLLSPSINLLFIYTT